MADDLMGFDMTLLHFRRTFVEKMFALHGKVMRLLEDGHALERDAGRMLHRQIQFLFVLIYGNPVGAVGGI